MANGCLFRWGEAADWIGETRDLLLEAVGPGGVERVRRHPAWSGGGSDLAWLEQTLVSGSSPPPTEVLVRRFAARFCAVEAFHTGRPVDPSSYLSRGILPGSPQRLREEAREVFCRSTDPRVSPEQLEEVLSRQDLSLIDGRAYFALDRRYLLECDTFYMLYGSHLLLAVAVRLQRATGLDFKPLLRARGVPCLFTCHVPVAYLPEEVIRELCLRTVYLALGDRRADGRPLERVRFDFYIRRRLPGTCIAGYSHPQDLVDHLYGSSRPGLVSAGAHQSRTGARSRGSTPTP